VPKVRRRIKLLHGRDYIDTLSSGLGMDFDYQPLLEVGCQ